MNAIIQARSAYKEQSFDRVVEITSRGLAESKLSSINQGELSFIRASANFQLSNFYEALSDYRDVLNCKEIGTKHSISAVYNMGTISFGLGEYAFSRQCLLAYISYQGHNTKFSKGWEVALDLVEGLHDDFNALIDVYKTFDKKEKTAKHYAIHNFVGTICFERDCYVFAKDFSAYIGGPENTTNAGLLFSIFEAYLNKEIDKSKKVLDWLMSLCKSDYILIYVKYMQIRLMQRMNEDREKQFVLAQEIVNSSHNSIDPNFKKIISFCSKIIKKFAPQNNILVPQKFGIIGISPLVMKMRNEIERYADSSLPVLIRGLSGTGKELTAKALHEVSKRNNRPFITVNCPAIPASLFESHLFGHRRGSFTGALSDKEGAIELCADGTLFLDEVGDLPTEAQAKLLRFLESGEFQRVGSNKIQHSKVRVIAATNLPLEDADNFRQDLFHRLSGLLINLPPIKERGDDIRYLARYRVAALNTKNNDIWKTLSQETEELLLELDYPGNVRQLFNVIDKAWFDAPQVINPEHIKQLKNQIAKSEDLNANKEEITPLNVLFKKPDSWQINFDEQNLSLKELQDQATCQIVSEAMHHFDGDIEVCANKLGISKRSIYRYMKKNRESVSERG
jgi:transcriptional regulator with GAF, ATPase, and Fis domain